MGHLLFDSFEAYRDAFTPQANELLADIPNYTSITPTTQFSEVKLWTARAMRDPGSPRR